MKESKFVEEFIKILKKKFPHMWEFNVHGHEMQRANVPDNIFSLNGMFTGIEFKVQRDGKIRIKPMQIYEINKIKDSKGIGLIIAYDENKDRLLVRHTRLNHNDLLENTKNELVSIKIDWDFEFNNYEDTVDLVGFMVGV